MTLAECAREAAALLERAGATREDSRRDTAVLARHVLRWDVAAWLTRQHLPCPGELSPALGPLVARRAAGEPVAYLTCEREFYGRAFHVTRDVLIPRPETELLVDLACCAIDEADGRPARVADVGTGSGCLAVSIAAERPDVRVDATDISPAAIVVARRNAARHGVDTRVTFHDRSLTGDLRDLDVIVSNPPYVPETSRDGLMRDVRDYEPATALFGGPDGLDVIRRLAPAAYAALRAPGLLLMEIGVDQLDAVTTLLRTAGFAGVTAHADLAGIPRVVAARRIAPAPPASL